MDPQCALQIKESEELIKEPTHHKSWEVMKIILTNLTVASSVSRKTVARISIDFIKAGTTINTRSAGTLVNIWKEVEFVNNNNINTQFLNSA